MIQQVSSIWSGETCNNVIMVIVNKAVVIMDLNVTHYEQRLNIP